MFVRKIIEKILEKQGVDLLPTIHEGPSIRQMEAKGIRTDKGEFNRWIKAINSVIREIKEKIAALLDWLKEVKDELSKPKASDLITLLQMYFNQRNAGAYSQRAKVNNLKEYSQLCQYLLDHDITDVDTLETHVSNLRSTTESLNHNHRPQPVVFFNQKETGCTDCADENIAKDSGIL